MKLLLRQLITTPLAIVSILGASNLFADWGPTIDSQRSSTTIPYFNIPIQPVLTITGGTAFSSRIGSNNTLPTVDSSTYVYSPSTDNDYANIVGFFIGGEYCNDPTYSTQLGLGYYQTSSFVVNGTVTQGVDPGSSNIFNYSYTLKSQELLIEGKILLNMGDANNYHPYFEFGLGESYNRTGNFSVTYPTFLTFTPIFADNSTASFAFNLGLGIDVDLSTHWRGGVGYRYANLGNSNLGAAQIDGTTISGNLQQENVYVSEIVAQFTYVF